MGKGEAVLQGTLGEFFCKMSPDIIAVRLNYMESGEDPEEECKWGTATSTFFSLRPTFRLDAAAGNVH